jgi:hypothetical protein
LHHIDNTAFFLGTDFYQAMFHRVHTGKPLSTGNTFEIAFKVISPSMVRADKGSGATAALGHLHATVAACVDKRTHFAIYTTYHDQRCTSSFSSDIAALFW